MKRIVIPSMLALALVSACASDGAGTTTAGVTGTTADVTATTAGATETTGGATETTAAATSGEAIAIVSSDLGDILADGEGRILYLFNPDAQGDPTCYNDCAEAWPALVEEVAAGDGVDASLVGSATRTDGGVQVTYNGWPLYYFSGDVAPGDTNGQGLNDVWWVVDATGNAVGA